MGLWAVETLPHFVCGALFVYDHSLPFVSIFSLFHQDKPPRVSKAAMYIFSSMMKAQTICTPADVHITVMQPRTP
jgi:hypothetical protein